MTRVGWVVLALVVLVLAGFASLTRFGSVTEAGRDAAPPPSAAGDLLRNTPGGYPRLAVPVAGVQRSQITDSWGDPRENGQRLHHGTDIMAPGGTLVTAAAPGMIEKLFTSRLGGITLYVRSPHRDWEYYYAHLAGYAPGVREGLAVKTGDPLGYVGDTGDAGPGNYHLHFGLTRMRPGERWWEGTDVNAYPLLAGTGTPG